LAHAATPLFDPVALRLWRLAETAPAGLAVVHVVRAREAPRFEAPAGRTGHWQLIGVHRHAVPTAVGCLAGVVRLSTAAGDRDLHPNEVAVIAPAAWHTHAPLRRGSVAYGQGLLFGRSDVILSAEGRDVAAFIPAQPSERLLHAILAASEPRRRLALGRDLLGQFPSSPAEAVRVNPAVLRMAARMWSGLDRPLRADEVLAASGLGERQAHRLFTAWFGVPPKRAIREQQLALAAELLREGALVAAAAAATGFADRRGFTRAWRMRHGSPPSRIRS